MIPGRWKVEGHDATPDGYHDHLLYWGDSLWQAIKAYRAALRNQMDVTITRFYDV